MNITFRCDPALIDLLPRPLPAKHALPEWLRAMAPRAESTVHGRSIRTVKQCPPFVDAMSHGFLIPLPCDVQVQAGRFSWQWPLPPLGAPNHPRAPLSFHVPEQLAGSPLARGTQSAIKFNSFWTIELPRGTPIAQCFAVLREPDTLLFEAMDDAHRERYGALAAQVMAGPGVYRKHFRSKRGA